MPVLLRSSWRMASCARAVAIPAANTITTAMAASTKRRMETPGVNEVNVRGGTEYHVFHACMSMCIDLHCATSQ